MLRSLSIGDSSLILTRKTIDGTLPPKVVLQFENGHKVSFSGNAWTEKRPEIVVFDSIFVEQNVYSGSSVSTGHRKNLLEFALGEPAVAARVAVDSATSEARAAAEAVQALKTQLAPHHVGLSIEQFQAIPNTASIDQKIAEVQGRINAAQNAATLLARPTPKAVSEPSFDLSGLFSLLGTSLADVHADAESVVKQHAHKLGGKSAESWLSQGRHFGGKENCPYCDQSIAANALVHSYQSYFNTAYSELKGKIATLQNTVSASTDGSVIDLFAQKVAAAKAEVSAWREQVKLPAIQFDEKSARAAMEKLRELTLDLVRRKQGAPAESLGTASDQQFAASLWKTVTDHVKAVNGVLHEAGAEVAKYKGQLASESVQQLQQQVQQLQASKRRHQPIVVDLFTSLSLAEAGFTKADNAKKAARDKLDALMTAVLQNYEKSINSLLKGFGASFSIRGMGANFRGTAPRSEYGLLVRGKNVDLDGGPPSFGTTLSEGDKRTLAFAFFVASTLADPKLGTRTVVVDDPMCSFDLNRKHRTRAVLRELHAKAEQLIVMAHDVYFLRDLREEFDSHNSTTPIAQHQLKLATDGYTDFGAIDLDRECESPYFQYHRILNDFLAGLPVDPRTAAKAIRPMLEGYLHRRFPGLIPQGLMFGQVVALMRDAVAPSPLVHGRDIVKDLNGINEYAGQFHHDTNPNADAIQVVSSELKTYIEHSLHVIHSGTTLT